MKKISWYKLRGMRNFFYRIFMLINKILIMLCGIIAFSVVAFVILAVVIAILDNPKLLESGRNISSFISWYSKADEKSSGYMASIVVATITTLLTGITIFQAHYTRRQDRAFSFPKNEVCKVSFGLNRARNIFFAEQNLKWKECNTLMSIEYKEALSSYLKGYPIVVYIILAYDSGNTLVEKLNIYSISYNTKKTNCILWLETSKSRLLPLYSSKSDKDTRCKMHISLDVRWTNMLLPAYIRGLSAIYVRENFRIKYVNKHTKESLENSYEVSDVSQSYMYLFSLRWVYCIITKIQLYIESKRRKRDSRRLEKR